MAVMTAKQNINGWIMEKLLGQGGFGAVYLYRHEVRFMWNLIQKHVYNIGKFILNLLIFCFREKPSYSTKLGF